jgi:glycosyltransferase involved in cell wall biosynthesis
MACGTPVIAFDLGSMPELIRHGVNGFLVTQVEDAVGCVSKLAEIDRSVCRRYVEERFSARRMAEDYIEVYRRILGLGQVRSEQHLGRE